MENTRQVLFEDNSPQWFIALDEGQWLGPLTATDVYEKVASQEISWAHYVWKEGQTEWKRLCDIETFQVAVPHQPAKNLQQSIQQVVKPAVKQARRAGTPPAPPPSDGGERIWFLFYNDSQFGPFSVGEIQRFLKVGKIHGRVHAWQDGMDNWARLEEIAEFKGTPERTLPSAAKSEHLKSEQRGAPRRPLVAKILMANDDSVILAVCRDISVGGMQVLTDKVPGKVGTRIKMNVSPAGGSGRMEPFVAEGLIVRILEDGRGFSFRFDRLSEIAKRSIETYIDATV